MKINGKRPDIVTLRCESLDLNYRRACRPIDTISLHEDVYQEPRTLIDVSFRDTMELDELINMLTDYRENMRQHLGIWEPEKLSR